MSRTHGDKFMGGNRGSYGKGIRQEKIPQAIPVKWNDFSGGYTSGDADEPEDARANMTPGGTDVEVTRRDRIIRAPGTVTLEAIAGGHTPEQLGIHAGLNYRSELILLDLPWVGIKREGATVWVNAGLPAGDPPTNMFYWATYGDDFIFSNGNSKVFKHTFGTNTVEEVVGVPLGATFAVWGGRFWVGAAMIDGEYEPLGLDWSGTEGYNDRAEDDGAGNELLIQDVGLGDRIVALRPMGFDYMAVLMRRSLWVARRVIDDLFRPADFISRVTGKGCVHERTARTTYGGVIYLSDEGVELFDGTQSIHLSQDIDGELLPLDYGNIHKYCSAFNPQSQRYFLGVPGIGVFVLDTLRKRWYKRTQVASDVVTFAQQFHAATWGEMIGSWAIAAGTWRSYAPSEADQTDMVFLGTKDDGTSQLEKEDANSTTYFGRAQKSVWIFPVTQQQRDLGLITSKELRVTYVGEGTLGVQLRNNDGDLAEVGTTAVAWTGKARTKKVNGQSTGKGVGLALRLQDAALPADIPVPVGSNQNINGIIVNINPFFAPGGFGGDFQSGGGSGASDPITLTFSGRGIRRFTITVEDPTFAVNKIDAYNAAGVLVATVNFDVSGAPLFNVPSTKTVEAPGIVKIVLTPGPADYVSYKNMLIVPEVQPLEIVRAELDFRLRGDRIESGYVGAVPPNQFGDFVP